MRQANDLPTLRLTPPAILTRAAMTITKLKRLTAQLADAFQNSHIVSLYLTISISLNIRNPRPPLGEGDVGRPVAS
jgi:hypothetical protein